MKNWYDELLFQINETLALGDYPVETIRQGVYSTECSMMTIENGHGHITIHLVSKNVDLGYHKFIVNRFNQWYPYQNHPDCNYENFEELMDTEMMDLKYIIRRM